MLLAISRLSKLVSKNSDPFYESRKRRRGVFRNFIVGPLLCLNYQIIRTSSTSKNQLPFFSHFVWCIYEGDKIAFSIHFINHLQVQSWEETGEEISTETTTPCRGPQIMVQTAVIDEMRPHPRKITPSVHIASLITPTRGRTSPRILHSNAIYSRVVTSRHHHHHFRTRIILDTGTNISTPITH